jgi:hypothetical protein
MASELLGAFLSDALALTGSPLTNAPGSAFAIVLQRVFKQRAEAARDILQDELRRGNITVFDAAADDEAAAILFRYLRSAQEGVARTNLRLLAQAIRGQMSLGKLEADEFLGLADVLAALRREEIVLLGAMGQQRESLSETSTSNDVAITAWTALEESLAGTPMFPTKNHVKATASALVRSGLIMMVSVWDGDIPVLSVLFDRFAAFCDFEAAAAEA